MLQKFINSQPESSMVPRATIRLAECYSRLNQPAEAERIYQSAFDRWPELINYLPVDSYSNLADHYLEKNKLEKAEQICFWESMFSQTAQWRLKCC